MGGSSLGYLVLSIYNLSTWFFWLKVLLLLLICRRPLHESNVFSILVLISFVVALCGCVIIMFLSSMYPIVVTLNLFLFCGTTMHVLLLYFSLLGWLEAPWRDIWVLTPHFPDRYRPRFRILVVQCAVGRYHMLFSLCVSFFLWFRKMWSWNWKGHLVLSWCRWIGGWSTCHSTV